jgi:hypothetical protein
MLWCTRPNATLHPFQKKSSLCAYLTCGFGFSLAKARSRPLACAVMTAANFNLNTLAAWALKLNII